MGRTQHVIAPPRATAPSPPERLLVAVTCGLIAVGAVYGGVALLTDPEGLGVETAWLDGSPFSSYDIPGVVLLVVIGGGMAATAALAIAGSHLTAPAAWYMAIALLAWGLVETITIGYQGWQQLVLLLVFVLVPAAALLTATSVGTQGDHP